MYKTIATAVLGNSGKESFFGWLVAWIGTAVSAYLGGWDAALKILVFCLVTDYITGLLGAFKTKNVNSEVMFWGGVRKGVIFLVIGLAVMLDDLLGNNTPLFRTLLLYFYIGREGLSIIENLGVIGVPLPPFIKKALEQLHDRGKGEQS